MKILFTCVFLFVSSLMFGQSSISIGPQLGIPSNFSKSTSVGFGGSMDYIYKISPSFGPRLSLGYNRFKGKYFEDDIISFVPIRVGMQGFLGNAAFLYGEAGTLFYHAKSNGTNMNNFSYAVGAGYLVPIAPRQFIQVSANYNFFEYSQYLTYSWFNIRVAYGLNFGKQTKDPI